MEVRNPKTFKQQCVLSSLNPFIARALYEPSVDEYDIRGHSQFAPLVGEINIVPGLLKPTGTFAVSTCATKRQDAHYFIMPL